MCKSRESKRGVGTPTISTGDKHQSTGTYATTAIPQHNRFILVYQYYSNAPFRSLATSSIEAKKATPRCGSSFVVSRLSTPDLSPCTPAIYAA